MTIDDRTAHTIERAGFTPFEYLTVYAPESLEPLYQDTYRGFGWSIESTEQPAPLQVLPLTPKIQRAVVVLKLKRQRELRNRAMLQTLQRDAEASLDSIARLERTKTTRAVVVATSVGLVGAALLAGSVFLLNAGSMTVSIALGAVGLVAWVGGYLAYVTVKERRTRDVVPRIEQELDTLYTTTEQASRLVR